MTDSHGRCVNGLRAENFYVFDNGVERPIVSFSSNEDPAQIVLLIESGTADYLLAKLGRSPFLRVDTLLDRISPSDRLAIVTYSDHAYVVLDFSPNAPAVRHALQRLNSEQVHSRLGSGPLELSSSLAAVLFWLRAIPGKKAIILLSTGIDSSLPAYRQFVEEELNTSDIPMLAVSLIGDLRKFPSYRKLSADEREERTFVKNGTSAGDEWLRRLAVETGGRVYLPRNVKDLEKAWDQIAQLVQSEYNLGFVPSLLDGKVHSIRVTVKHRWNRSYHVAHRRTYLAGTRSDK